MADLKQKYDVAVGALRQLAAFNDTGASEHLRLTGGYSLFDEPGAVRLSRSILELLEAAPVDDVSVPRDLLERLFEKMGWLQDEGPIPEGWKSASLTSDLADLEKLL